MKKMLIRLLLLLSLFSLSSCVGGEPQQNEASFKMKARVSALSEYIEVECVESEYTSGPHWVISSDKTEFSDKNGKRIRREDLAPGDMIEISYNGQVMMSYPPKIVAHKIKVI